MKKKVLFTAALAGLLLIGVVNYFANPDLPPSTEGNVVILKKNAELELNKNMRKLWEDHVTWTRNVIFCIIDDLPGTDEAVERLLKNQEDIGDAIKPYYDNEAGKQLTALLRTHITQAADLLKAAKADDKEKFEQINNEWKKNGDEIAMFLSKANPNWKEDHMKKMMQDHLSLTIDEANARKKKDYKADVAAYEKVHLEILEMSDMLTDGIIKQFPDKFKMDDKIGKK